MVEVEMWSMFLQCGLEQIAYFRVIVQLDVETLQATVMGLVSKRNMGVHER